MKKNKNKSNQIKLIVIAIIFLSILFFPRISGYNKSNGFNNEKTMHKYEVEVCQCNGLEKRITGKFPGEYTKYCIGVITSCKFKEEFAELDDYTKSVLELNK